MLEKDEIIINGTFLQCDRIGQGVGSSAQEECCVVTSINFKYNKISAEGAKALVEMLKKNKIMTGINFGYNL